MIINVYKPVGWTSFDVVAKIRRLSGIKKVGHAGTLDPLAEGVLLVLTEADTKKQDSFKDLKKAYYFEFFLGVSTPSADLESTPIFIHFPNTKNLEARINRVLEGFVGTIKQKAPAYSAKKVDGKRLYDLARKDPTKADQLERPESIVTIYSVKIEGLTEAELTTDAGVKTLPFVKCFVECSSGTYVRQLALDIAEKLGTTAVVSKIVRTAIGDYTIETSTKIEELKF